MAGATVRTGRARGAEPSEERGEPDRWLLGTVLLLAGVGLAFVFSASQALAYLEKLSPLYYFEHQLLGLGLGLVLMLVLARLDHHRLRRHARPLAGGALLLMVLVLVPHLGVQVNGASRWLSLGPLGTFQPSELGKLAFILFLAQWVERRGERLHSLEDGVAPFALMLAGVAIVLLLEKDLGTAIVTTAIFLSIFWAGGGRPAHIALLAGGLVVAFVLMTLATPYRAQRIGSFLDPFRDPLNTGFQSTQALIGLGNGGLTGVGLGHSVQKFLWLPEAHTDFIFAIVGEETGLLGASAVLAAFLFFAVRGYRAAMRAEDTYGVMVATGITTWIVVQALINIGTVTDAFPATGVPLPFISYGGTSLAALLAAVGVLLNVSARGRDGRLRNRPVRGHAFQEIDATADNGRRDGRPPLPGTRRRAGVRR